MDKSEHKKRIAKKIEETAKRPPVTQKEQRLRAAATATLAGDKNADICRMFAVTQGEIARYMRQLFPAEEDRFQFLEEAAITNAALAGKRFQDCFGEMTPADAARAFAAFSGKALEIRKARESGFKEPEINVQTIIALEQTLKLLSVQNEKTVE